MAIEMLLETLKTWLWISRVDDAEKSHSKNVHPGWIELIPRWMKQRGSLRKWSSSATNIVPKQWEAGVDISDYEWAAM